MRRYWLVGFWKNGFEGKVLVYGTEEELWNYMNPEIESYHYTEATEDDVKAAVVLRIKIYICPELEKRPGGKIAGRNSDYEVGVINGNRIWYSGVDDAFMIGEDRVPYDTEREAVKAAEEK